MRCLNWLDRHSAVWRQAVRCPVSPSVTSGSCVMIKSCVWEGLLTVSCQTNVSSSDSFNVSNVTVINQGPWQTSPVAAPPQKKYSVVKNVNVGHFAATILCSLWNEVCISYRCLQDTLIARGQVAWTLHWLQKQTALSLRCLWNIKVSNFQLGNKIRSSEKKILARFRDGWIDFEAAEAMDEK